MLEVHHLNNSRSQRVLWLLEELGLPYQIQHHQRDTATNLAPDSLKKIHALGKSPVLRDGETVVIESGAILEYVVRKYGKGRLAPADPLSADGVRYLQLMHYAEGSAMLPLMLNLYVSRLGDAGKPLHPRIESEIANHLGYLDGHLKGRGFLVGDSLTGADIQMSFIPEIAEVYGKRAAFPYLDAWIKGLHARPAWKKALEKGGPYRFDK